jgi:dTDP-4-dehydrorhamnose 3,5-epimerase
MKFFSTIFEEVFLIGLEPREDERGMFSRAFCHKEFKDMNLEYNFIQANINSNKKPGIIRGMHFQTDFAAEVKLVRCISGAIYDVVVDIRKESPTYLKSFGAELTQENGLAMYVPKGFAHGYQSLTTGSTAFYLVSSEYNPKYEGGIRPNDPKLDIKWPLENLILSEKDKNWPLL